MSGTPSSTGHEPKAVSPAMRLYHAADAVMLQFVDDPGEYSDRERADVLGRLREAMATFAMATENG